MIGKREAVERATNYLIDVLSKAPDDLRVEEFYPANGVGVYKLALSYTELVTRHEEEFQEILATTPRWFTRRNPRKRERVLKYFEVDANTGVVLGMKGYIPDARDTG